MTLRIGSLVWGVRDVPRAIRFWCEALRYKLLRPPSEDWAILVPLDGEGQQMAITIVSSDPESHQRHHLDLYASDREAEVERLLGLGASRVAWRYPDGADYVVLIPTATRSASCRSSHCWECATPVALFSLIMHPMSATGVARSQH